MADTNQTVILRIQLDEGKTEERLRALVTDIQATKQAQQDLAATKKAGAVSEAEYTKQVVGLRLQLKGQQGEQAALTANLTNYRLAVASATGSVDGLKAQSALLTAQYNKLSEAERTETEAGRTLGAELKKTNEALLAAGKNVGDYRRNVGNYASAFEGITGYLDKLGSSAKALPGPLAGIGAGLVGTASGFISATRAAVAFIATPIGAVLALVSAAIYAVKTAFEGSAEGQGKYNRGMALLGVVLGNVKDVVIAVGERLIDAFSKPQESLEKIGGFLREQIVNRFVGLLELIPNVGRAVVLLFKGQFAEAGKVAANAVGKVYLGINDTVGAFNAASEAAKKFAAENESEVKKQQIANELKRQAGKAERELITQRAEIQDRVATLELQARQKEQFSAQQRRGFLLEAGRLNDELYGKEARIATLRRDAGAIEAKLHRQTKQDLLDQAERQKNVIEAGTRAVDARRANQRLLNSLNGEIAAEEQKRREDTIRAEQTANELALVAAEKGSAAELALKQQAVDLAAELEINGAKKTGEQINLIRAKAEGDKRDLLNGFLDKQLEDVRKHDAARVAQEKLDYEQALEKLNGFLYAQRAALEQQNARGLLTQKQYASAVLVSDQIAAGSRLQLAKEYRQNTVALEKSAAEVKM